MIFDKRFYSESISEYAKTLIEQYNISKTGYEKNLVLGKCQGFLDAISIIDTCLEKRKRSFEYKLMMEIFDGLCSTTKKLNFDEIKTMAKSR